jgi:hypothetical protein
MRYKVEIPKTLGEDSAMYPDYAANYKIKMALLLI